MSRRVEVFIKNILPAHSHGAYTLVLHNPTSKIQLPVLIGTVEAQSIAMEIEKLQSSRPLTHDLFSHTLKHYQIEIHEVCIEKLEEGIYYATIYFMKDGESVGIDSRTSDAIAMAIKFDAPIFVLQHIIDEAGYHDEEEEMDMDAPGRITNDELPPQQKVDHHSPYSDKTDEELENMLDEAISIEDYVKAARIRDEITRRK